MQTQLQQMLVKMTASSAPWNGGSRVPRLRVLHVVSCFGMGGTEHGVLKVIAGLGHDEFEHHVCAVRGADEDFLRQTNVEASVSSAGSREPGFQFPLFRLVRLMRRFRPHVVHSRNFGALEAILAARIAGVPGVIHSEHGYEIEILKGLPLRRRLACGALYSMADQLLTVTDDLRKYHSKQSWHSPSRFRVIHNGVDTETFRPRTELRLRLRLEMGILPGRVVIGSVGRIVPIKDHRTLLRAGEALLRSGKDVHLLIVGSGPELPNLQAQVNASPELAGRTLLLGSSDRVPDLLSCLDVFVLPSISEGMSNTMLEAMATGLPLVVTRAGGNVELLDHGRTGYLFNPGDAEALTCILTSLVDDTSLRQRFGQAAREYAIRHFSLSTMVQRYRDLYLGLASKLRARGR